MRCALKRSLPIPFLLQDDALLAERGDLVPAVSQIQQYFLRVLAQGRRGRANCAGRLAQRDGKTRQLDRRALRHGQVDEVVVGLNLRVVGEVAVRVDGAAGDLLRFQRGQPLVPRASSERLIEERYELGRVLLARLAALKARLVREFRPADDTTQDGPLALVDDRDREPAVGGAVEVEERRPLVARAGLGVAAGQVVAGDAPALERYLAA